MVLVLTRQDVESILTMKDTMMAVEEAFRQLDQGTVDMPLRPVIRPRKYGGLVTFMPAYIDGMDALGMKLVTAYPDNPKKYDLPTILGTILLNDPRTGALLSIMDGAWITAMRTGAAGGVATKYLAREDSRTIGVFGAGVQAKTQLMAVKETRNVKEARAYDIVPENARKFSEEMTAKLGITVVATKNAIDVVSESDIVIAATTSKVPVFNGDWLKLGAHINGIGSHHGPGVKELDEATIKKAKVVVDQRDASLREAGDLIDPISKGTVTPDHIYAELGEIVSGKKKGRTSSTEITLFKSVGLAIQDISTAVKVYELAKNMGIGKNVDV
jgi:alanine dehydrogenase